MTLKKYPLFTIRSISLLPVLFAHTFFSNMFFRSLHKKRTPIQTCSEILQWATSDPIRIDQWLMWNIYDRTNKINVREMISNPSAIYNGPINNYIPETNNVELQLNIIYGGIIDGVYFNESSNSLNNILDIGPFATEHNDIFELLFSNTPFSSINFPLIGDLFDDIIVRQHRIGGIIQGSYSWNNIALYGQAPIIYNLRHIYADPEVQERLSDQISTLSNDSSSKNNSEEDFSKEYIKKHLVSDSIGIERGLIAIQYMNIAHKPLSIHFRILTPGITFKEGIIGSDFSKISHEQKNNFKLSYFLSKIVSEASESDILQEEQSFFSLFSDMLDRITDSSFFIPYNKKPWGLSPACSFTFDFKNDFSINCLIQYTYEFPTNQFRYGYVRPPENNLPRHTQGMTEAQACSALEKYNNEFLYRTILTPFYASINNGYEFQTCIALRCQSCDIAVQVGYDIWYKNGESINEIKTTIPARITYTLTESAAQGKIFGSCEFNKEKWDIIWDAKIRSDITLFSTGIGKEFCIALTLGVQY
jgi:hypothetical protein